MNRTKKLLIELIEELGAFEASLPENREVDMDDFLAFIIEKRPALKSRNDAGEDAPWLTDMGKETETVVARLVVVMNKYAKSYIKRALSGSPIQTGDEFVFLLFLLTFPSLTKTELINKNLLEKTSGIEIIKRLLKAGLVREFDDEQDRRSKRIALTDLGRAEVLKVLPKIHQVSFLVSGNLSANERKTLAYLLTKLDHYHHDIYKNDRFTEFDELNRKYLKQKGE